MRMKMTRKGVKKKNTRDVVTAGKIAGEGTKALVAELANAAATAAAKAATMAAAGVALDKVATAIATGKPSITSMQETVVAAGKSAAEGVKALAGEVAGAVAKTGVVMGKVAAVARKPSSRANKKVAKRVAAKKRAAPKKKAKTKKASRTTTKKKRI